MVVATVFVGIVVGVVGITELVTRVRPDPRLAWVSNTSEQGYRRLEETLDAELASRLPATLAHPEPDARFAALLAAIDLCRDLWADVVERVGIDVDPAPEKRVREAIESHYHST